MNDNDNDIWRYDNLEINDDGHVTGSAYTEPFRDGYDVVIGITSYDYERSGETKTNHVPHIVVSNPDGSIVSEPEAWDTENPEKAIENARGAAEAVLDNPDDYIDE